MLKMANCEFNVFWLICLVQLDLLKAGKISFSVEMEGKAL